MSAAILNLKVGDVNLSHMCRGLQQSLRRTAAPRERLKRSEAQAIALDQWRLFTPAAAHELFDGYRAHKAAWLKASAVQMGEVESK